jgi:hypothetical protein
VCTLEQSYPKLLKNGATTSQLLFENFSTSKKTLRATWFSRSAGRTMTTRADRWVPHPSSPPRAHVASPPHPSVGGQRSTSAPTVGGLPHQALSPPVFRRRRLPEIYVGSREARMPAVGPAAVVLLPAASHATPTYCVGRQGPTPSRPSRDSKSEVAFESSEQGGIPAQAHPSCQAGGGAPPEVSPPRRSGCSGFPSPPVVVLEL